MRPHRFLCLATTLIATALALPAGAATPRLGQALRFEPALPEAKSPPAAGTQALQTGGFVVDIGSRQQSRAFYNLVYQGTAYIDPAWSGAVATCTPGTTSTEFKERVLGRINYYRAMAGVPSNVSLRDDLSAKAQQMALMMSANNGITHFPPASWSCYTTDGADAADSSNLSLGHTGPDAVTGQMQDNGTNNTVAGHRRWILYPHTTQMGTGDVPANNGHPAANDLWVLPDAQNATASRPATRDSYVAWPPPGYVPWQTVYPRWSFSYPGADFSGASVTMSKNGTPMSVTVEAVANGYGENTLVWYPNGADPVNGPGSFFQPASGDDTYAVSVQGVVIGGVQQDFQYQVTVFDPAVAGSNEAHTGLTGPASLTVGGTGTYQITPVSFATRHEGVQCTAQAGSFTEGGEDATPAVIDHTAPDYDLITSAAPASGSQHFHLAHPNSGQEWFELANEFLPSASTQLVFQSRLGWATSTQVARVQILSDGLWQTVYSQAGSDGSGESAYQTRTVSLAAFAGKPVRVRFLYDHIGGSYYYQTTASVGWLIDDISLSDVDRLDNCTTTDLGSATTWSWTPAATGRFALYASSYVWDGYGALDQSPARLVEVTADSDGDGDGVADGSDNCPHHANADQRDTNGDGYGNVCDPDLNGDNVVNAADLAALIDAFLSTGNGLDADFDGDARVNFRDLSWLRKYWNRALPLTP